MPMSLKMYLLFWWYLLPATHEWEKTQAIGSSEEKHYYPLTFESCKPLQSLHSSLEFISLPVCHFVPKNRTHSIQAIGWRRFSPTYSISPYPVYSICYSSEGTSLWIYREVIFSSFPFEWKKELWFDAERWKLQITHSAGVTLDSLEVILSLRSEQM